LDFNKKTFPCDLKKQNNYQIWKWKSSWNSKARISSLKEY
jgi:hypothetical protein